METVSFHSYRNWPEVDPQFPTSVAIPQGMIVGIAEGDTGFGFVCSGVAQTESPGFKLQLSAGMFFSAPGPTTVIGLHGFLCSRKAYRGLPIWGGPIETFGRLKYIDGCSDTLLLAPPIKGDPCLNYLYIPPGVSQTPHTHPSVRVGCILDGAGICQLASKTIDLVSGDVFVLPTDELHGFHTQGQHLRVVVYHPDSDFGPTDEAHPMINRTIIGKKTKGDGAQLNSAFAE
jgi:quercetin dioxygenase-like cupin family protein